jgi:hypothetical protein
MWGCGDAICLACKYDAKIVIPLLMTCFDKFNPTSQACVICAIVFAFQFEE